MLNVNSLQPIVSQTIKIDLEAIILYVNIYLTSLVDIPEESDSNIARTRMF